MQRRWLRVGAALGCPRMRGWDETAGEIALATAFARLPECRLQVRPEKPRWACGCKSRLGKVPAAE